MSTAASTLTIIAALIALMGIQTFWIARSIDALARRIEAVERRLDQMFAVLLEHGERIARLEEKVGN